VNPEEAYTNEPEVQSLVTLEEEDNFFHSYPVDSISLASQVSDASEWFRAARNDDLAESDDEITLYSGASEYVPDFGTFVGKPCSELSSVSGDSCVEGCMDVYGKNSQPYFVQTNRRRYGPPIYTPTDYYSQCLLTNERKRRLPCLTQFNMRRLLVQGEDVWDKKKARRILGPNISMCHGMYQIFPMRPKPILNADETICEFQLLYNAMLALEDCEFASDSSSVAKIENTDYPGSSCMYKSEDGYDMFITSDGRHIHMPVSTMPIVIHKRETRPVKRSFLKSLFSGGDLNCNSSLGNNVHTVHEVPEVPSGTEQVTPFGGTSRTLGSSLGAATTSAPYRQSARQRWLGSRDKNIESQQDRIRRLADKQGISYEEARGAYQNATEAMPSQGSILPTKKDAYKRRSAWNRGPSTRAQSTVDVTLSSPEMDAEVAAAVYYFNPVSQQELQEMAARGNTMISIDAVEIAIDPVGMPGDDTDLTVMLLWPQNSDPQRALIGAVSTFVGNGLARCVFFPGLKLLHDHCSVADGRVLKIIVSSTNSTMLQGLPQAQISIGTLRQHLGSGHDRTITQDLALSQIGGYRIGATQQGSATVFAPRGGAVEGTPSVNANIGAGSVLVQTGPLSWKAQRSQSSRFVVEGTSRQRLSVDGSSIPVVSRPNRNVPISGETSAPRYATANSGIAVDPTLAYAKQIKVKQDARVGTILDVIDIHNNILEDNRLVALEWISKGLVSSTFKLRITVGANPFVGITIGVVIDAFNRLDPKAGSSVVAVPIAFQMTNYLFPISTGSVWEKDIDIGKDAGYNFFPAKPAFSRPKIILYIVDDNSLPASDSWLLTYELFMSQLESAPLAVVPRVILPHAFDGNLPLDVWRGPFSFPLGGGTRHIPVGLDMGRSTHTIGKHKTISQTAAYTRLLMGHGGILNAEIVRIGSSAVTCALHVNITFGEAQPSIESALYLPGFRLPLGEGKFKLKIQTPYFRTNMRQQDTFLNVYAVGGPIAVENFNAPYQFAIHLESITDDKAPPRMIGMLREFNWATIINFKNDDSRFVLPARLCDILYAGADIHMRDHPLALLIGSCGFFRGSFTITLEWSTSGEQGKKQGVVQLLTCYGCIGLKTYTIHDIVQSSTTSLAISTSTSRHLTAENFSGFVQSGGQPDTDEVFLEFWSNCAKSIRMLNINVELDENFEIYGRSILPIRADDGKIWDGSSPAGNSTEL
jgi:hypothetical protein